MGYASHHGPGHPKQTAARCTVWPQTEHSYPHGVKTDPLTSSIPLTHWGRMTSWLSGKDQHHEHCDWWGPLVPKMETVTLVIFGFSPFLSCSVTAEGTAVFHPHSKSHLFTPSGGLFLYLRFHQVRVDGFTSLGIVSVDDNSAHRKFTPASSIETTLPGLMSQRKKISMCPSPIPLSKQAIKSIKLKYHCLIILIIYINIMC